MESEWKKDESFVKEGYLEMLEQGLEELVAGYGEQAQHIRALLSGTIAVEKALSKENGNETNKPEKSKNDLEYQVNHLPKDLFNEFYLLKEALDRCEEQKEILCEERREVSAKKFALQEFKKMQDRLEASEREIERLEAENAELHAQLFTVRKSRDSYCNHSSALLKEKIRLTQQIELLKEMTLMSLQSAKEPKKMKNLSKYLVPSVNTSISSTASTPEYDCNNSETSNSTNIAIGRHNLHQNPYFATSDTEFSYYHSPSHRSRSAFSSPVHRRSGRRGFLPGIGKSTDSWLPSLNQSEKIKSTEKTLSESVEQPPGSLGRWIKENQMKDIKTSNESQVLDIESQTNGADSQTVGSDTESVVDLNFAENASTKSEYDTKSKEKLYSVNGRLKPVTATANATAANVFKHLGKSARENTKELSKVKFSPTATSFAIPVKSAMVSQQKAYTSREMNPRSLTGTSNFQSQKAGDRSSYRTEAEKSKTASRRESFSGLKNMSQKLESQRKGGGGWR